MLPPVGEKIAAEVVAGSGEVGGASGGRDRRIGRVVVAAELAELDIVGWRTLRMELEAGAFKVLDLMHLVVEQLPRRFVRQRVTEDRQTAISAPVRQEATLQAKARCHEAALLRRTGHRTC